MDGLQLPEPQICRMRFQINLSVSSTLGMAASAHRTSVTAISMPVETQTSETRIGLMLPFFAAPLNSTARRARASTLDFLRTGSPLCFPSRLKFFGRGHLLGFTQERSNKLISFFPQ